jgi:hypothetical protein
MTMKKQNNPYQGIQTLEELDAAIHETRERIASQGETVRSSFLQVQEFYTPRHMAVSSLQKFALDHHLYTIAINAVTDLKHLLKKK